MKYPLVSLGLFAITLSATSSFAFPSGLAQSLKCLNQITAKSEAFQGDSFAKTTVLSFIRNGHPGVLILNFDNPTTARCVFAPVSTKEGTDIYSIPVAGRKTPLYLAYNDHASIVHTFLADSKAEASCTFERGVCSDDEKSIHPKSLEVQIDTWGDAERSRVKQAILEGIDVAVMRFKGGGNLDTDLEACKALNDPQITDKINKYLSANTAPAKPSVDGKPVTKPTGK